ncbi:hypothetical protein [uncultured Oscillibacter sp.]|uniref:hypothetical protein n=1 Tax=uncultured Oscillibacter sp. TaxID=876091 RepID=UPI0025E0B91A|nr:hypothetical protein [uncultured Oscillibacter sp.]
MWRLCDLPNRIRVSPGFCLLTAWFALDNGWELLGTVLGAAAVHELGHCLVLWLLSAPINGLKIGIFGAELAADRRGLSYPGELAAVLAGPGANLLCAALLTLLGGTRWAVFSGANLVLCAFNLLPVRPLDGGRALYLLTAWAAGPAEGEKAVRWAGGGASLILAASLVWVMVRTGGSLWLLPAAAGLLAAAGRELWLGGLKNS